MRETGLINLTRLLGCHDIEEALESPGNYHEVSRPAINKEGLSIESRIWGISGGAQL